MAENTHIEWCDHTFNPWIGCTKVSPACDHCYAEAYDKRFTGGERWGPHAARTKTSAANWKKPLAWDRKAKAAGVRAKVFCASLADVFDNHKSIDRAWRAELWGLIKATPNLDWLLLTKRPQNIGHYLPRDWDQDFNSGYPNVWLGTTVENQLEAERRIPVLLDIQAKKRFLSVEPLLGQINFENATRKLFGPLSGYCQRHFPRTHCGCSRQQPSINWVIAGGESGPGARAMRPEWARSIRDQCTAAGVPFHFKQWGEWNEKGVRVGKKAAGRLLDGRTWDQFPKDALC